MNNYRIFIKSNNHPKTINTPNNARLYWNKIEVNGTRQELIEKVNELKNNGTAISQICTNLGKRIYL